MLDRHGVDVPAGLLVGEFDTRQVIEVADGEDAVGVEGAEDRDRVSDGGAGVQALAIKDNGLIGDGVCEGKVAHRLRLVAGPFGGAAGEDELGRESLVVELAGREDAIPEGEGRDIVLRLRPKDHNHIGRAAVVA